MNEIGFIEKILLSFHHLDLISTNRLKIQHYPYSVYSAVGSLKQLILEERHCAHLDMFNNREGNTFCIR